MSRWPDANWAVATGHVNGFIVIDIDPRHNGFTSMNQYEDVLLQVMPYRSVSADP
jgi:hypothetical protein